VLKVNHVFGSGLPTDATTLIEKLFSIKLYAKQGQGAKYFKQQDVCNFSAKFLIENDVVQSITSLKRVNLI